MKELIPKDEYGIFVDSSGTARVDSLFVAEYFEKNHKEVLRDIRNLLAPEYGLSEEFRQRNYTQSFYINRQNRRLPCFLMTRDGFAALTMGYTGQAAVAAKEQIVKYFKEIEEV